MSFGRKLHARLRHPSVWPVYLVRHDPLTARAPFNKIMEDTRDPASMGVGHLEPDTSSDDFAEDVCRKECSWRRRIVRLSCPR